MRATADATSSSCSEPAQVRSPQHGDESPAGSRLAAVCLCSSPITCQQEARADEAWLGCQAHHALAAPGKPEQPDDSRLMMLSCVCSPVRVPAGQAHLPGVPGPAGPHLQVRPSSAHHQAAASQCRLDRSMIPAPVGRCATAVSGQASGLSLLPGAGRTPCSASPSQASCGTPGFWRACPPAWTWTLSTCAPPSSLRYAAQAPSAALSPCSK